MDIKRLGMSLFFLNIMTFMMGLTLNNYLEIQDTTKPFLSIFVKIYKFT